MASRCATSAGIAAATWIPVLEWSAADQVKAMATAMAAPAPPISRRAVSVASGRCVEIQETMSPAAPSRISRQASASPSRVRNVAWMTPASKVWPNPKPAP